MDGCSVRRFVEPKEPVEPIQFNPDLSPIDYLLARMRDPRTEDRLRTKIAIALLPFTTPKLAVTANIDQRDFGTLLDQRIKRAKLYEQKVRAIEEQVNGKQIEPSKVIEGSLVNELDL